MFLTEPEPSEARDAMYESDIDGDGYVNNFTKAWAWMPEARAALFDLIGDTADAAGLTFRDKGVLVTTAASTLGDSYCSMAWGRRLAAASDDVTAAAVVMGDDSDALTDRERVMAAWARRLARDPNATTPEDVAALRSVGFDDQQIFAMTAYIAMRIAFATVNDAVGAGPDLKLFEKLPGALASAITYGRPASDD